MGKILLLLFAAFLVGCKVGEVADTTKPLTIHIINVQQGDSILVIGPNGTTLLIDGGNTGRGKSDVVPYLRGLGIENGIDYMVNTHRDEDHLGGLDEVIAAGLDVRKNIWDNGSDKTGVAITGFLSAANGTTAGAVTAIPLGQVIDLGNGARATAVAVGGEILGTTTIVSVTDENDKSVALLIQYKGFDYITAGDIGGGEFSADKACTGRKTTQKNVETPLAQILIGSGLLTENGVEAMKVNHHGSESSTNFEYMNLLTPKIAIISVGEGQGVDFHHPRKDIVENVLMAKGTCIEAPPALVLQTDEEGTIDADSSAAGFVAGDIVITITGNGTYQASGSGRVSQGIDERSAGGIDPPLSLPID